MAVLIEETFGRAKLSNCLCDPAAFLVAYNEAAAKRSVQTGEVLAMWSPELLKRPD